MAKQAGKSRSAAVKVNLMPDLYEKLKVLADRQGQTAASLGALAVGQYVSAHWGPVEMQDRMVRETMAILNALPAQLELMEAAKE